jgi:Ca-activated chloride channel homolog
MAKEVHSARKGQYSMLENVTLKLKRYASVGRRSIPYQLLLMLLATSLFGSGEDKVPSFKASTELVQISVVALDPQGRVSTGLTKQDFEIYEDGVKQNVVECMTETAPVSLAFVLDRSRSMRSNLPLVMEGSSNVLDTHVQPDDEFLLVFFDSVPELIFPQFTGNADALKHLISSNLAEAKGLTSLYDALYIGVSNVKQKAKNVHRAVIVITDGGDTNSHYTKREIREYLEEADVPLYALNASEPNIFQTLTIGKNGKAEIATESDVIGPAERGGPKVLKELTNATGGAVFTAHEPEDIPRMMGVIYDLISNQYTISYKPPHGGASGNSGRHKIQVKLATRDARFAGYYLSYKHQYYRPGDRGKERAMAAPFLSDERF